MTDVSSRRPRRALELLLVGLLLAGFWLLAPGTSAVRDKSATFDEIAHLVRGHVARATGDFRLAFARAPLEARLGRRRFRLDTRLAKAGALSGVLALQLLIARDATWAVNGHRYETFRLPPSPHDRMRSQSTEEATRGSWEGGHRGLPTLERVVEPLRRGRLLPETLLHGLVHGAQDSRRG